MRLKVRSVRQRRTLKPEKHIQLALGYMSLFSQPCFGHALPLGYVGHLLANVRDWRAAVRCDHGIHGGTACLLPRALKAAALMRREMCLPSTSLHQGWVCCRTLRTCSLVQPRSPQPKWILRDSIIFDPCGPARRWPTLAARSPS